MTYGVWYFILANEVAHHLVQLHNSEREFYFPTICEKYLVSLQNPECMMCWNIERYAEISLMPQTVSFLLLHVLLFCVG